MADKKLNSVSTATTVANFYGNQGGADVQIPLATAASVLAEAKWESLSSGEETKVTVNNNNCILIIGHNYYGFGFYLLCQSSGATLVGGVDATQRGVTITISGASATIKNNGVNGVSYKFL